MARGDGIMPKLEREIFEALEARERPVGPVETAAPERDVLRKLAEAATPGPWGWRGHTDHGVELESLRSGARVVAAMRARPCIVTGADGDAALTDDACDDCRDRWARWERMWAWNARRDRLGLPDKGDPYDVWEGYRCPRPENLGTVWLWDRAGFVRPANHWAVQQVSYRTDVARVDHPDARYLAAVSPDVVLALLDEIEGMDTLLDAFLCGCGNGLDDAHRPGGKCANCLAAAELPACPGDPDPQPPRPCRTCGASHRNDTDNECCSRFDPAAAGPETGATP